MITKVHPSADLHLLRGMSVDLDLLITHPDTNDWQRPNFLLVLPASVTLATFAQPTLTASPTLTGTVREFLKIQDPPGTDVLEVPIQISVHETIRRVWCSSTHHEVEVGSSDRVLVVYAEFGDGTNTVTADVTGRSFLRYSQTWVTAAGRVQAPATAGTWTVIISVDSTLGITPVPITASVVINAAAPALDFPILVKHHEGTEVRRKAILFIAEGWTADMEVMFNDLCKFISRGVKKVQPYNRLVESLEIYSAFVPSAEEGITVGADVVVSPTHPVAFPLIPDGDPLTEVVIRGGHPDQPGAPTTLAGLKTATGIADISQPTFNTWKLLGSARPMRVRDTAWGLTITYPHRGPYTHFQLVASPDHLGLLPLSSLKRGPGRAPYFADHRLPDLLGTPPQDPATAHVNRLFDFLGKLRLPNGSVSPRMGERWRQGGDSDGMVVFLARCDLHGGVSIPGDQTCAVVTTGREDLVGVGPSSIPGLLDVIPGGTASFDAETLRRMADVVAHELAHSPMLGFLHDEYGSQVMQASIASWIPLHVNGKPNAHMLEGADGVEDGAGPAIDLDKVPWQWPRVQAGASVEHMTADGADVVFTLSLSHALRWPKAPAGQPVWLRRGPLWPKLPGRAPLAQADNPLRLELVSYDRQQQLVRCRPPAGKSPADVVTSFWGTPGPLTTPTDIRIVLQRVDEANLPLWLINDAIVAELAGGPLTTSLGCTEALDRDRRAAIENLRQRTPAVYEGGAGYDCKTVKPAIACKMRWQRGLKDVGSFRTLWVERFCVVCQYVMTYQVDPSLLPRVDKLLIVEPAP